MDGGTRCHTRVRVPFVHGVCSAAQSLGVQAGAGVHATPLSVWWPGGHAWHAAKPGALMVPSGHRLHSLPPAASWYSPAPHALHDVGA